MLGTIHASQSFSNFMDHVEDSAMEQLNQGRGGGADDALLQAQALLWNHTLSYIESMSLRCAIELGIPDAIHSHGRPMTADELAAALSISPTKAPPLRRLMRVLTHLGFFSAASGEENDAYSLTAVSRLTLKDKATDLAPFSLFITEPFMVTPFQFMSAWFRSNGEAPAPFHMAHRGCVWDVLSQQPLANKICNDAMASDSCFLTDTLVKKCGHLFQGLESLVDVAGGTGSVARAIGEAFPQLKVTVLDLPHVVDGATKDGTVDFVAGDMFEYIPCADVVLLKDWSHGDCVKILRRCKEAIPSREAGGKVIIVDAVVDTKGFSDQVGKAQLFMDMLMMSTVGGMEREEHEWKKMFMDAGFTDYKIAATLGPRAVIEVYP